MGKESAMPSTEPKADSQTNPAAPPDINSRRHGKGFTYMSLRDAEDAIRKIDHHSKRMSKDGFARALGHKKAEGRFPNKLASLEDYKLVQADGEDVVLLPLAVDMLYGGSEATRTKARTTAFLNYNEFQKTFSECPKGQDHPIEYILDYVKGKLGIVNEVDRFKRLFLESAQFAGLIDGDIEAGSKTVKFRHATAAVAGEKPGTPPEKQESAFEVVAGDQAAEMLTSFGLSDFADRAQLMQKVAGKVLQRFEDGLLVLEINRPIRIAIKSNDVLLDFPEVIKAMRAKGLSI